MLMNFLFWPLKTNVMPALLSEKVKDQGQGLVNLDSITFETFVSKRNQTEE